jgi:hypothetical protein
MAAEVDFQDKEGYVYVDIRGSSDKSDLLSVFEKIMIYSTVKKATKMLIDFRELETVFPFEDILVISDKFTNIQGDYEGISQININFAFLINEELHDSSFLNETLSSEEEQPMYLGGKYEEAEKWLLSE